MRPLALALVWLAVALLPSAGIASGTRAATSNALTGITGNAARFQDQTGQASQVVQAFLGWGQGAEYGAPFPVLFQSLGPIPMIHLGTPGRNGAEAITPGQIAAGKGDAYLVALNEAISAWGRGIYVRPLAEMNNPKNPWAGYNADGSPRDAAHSPATFRKAFARIYLILHGGTKTSIDAALRKLGLPPLEGADLPSNPYPRLRVVWSPLAAVGVRAAGNAPEQYYPGPEFVDVEGAGIYDDGVGDQAPWAEFEGRYQEALAHRRPFSIPEWGMKDIDDPAFVRHMCSFLSAHPAIELQAFYEARPGSPYDLGTKPQSAAAFRSCVRPLAATAPPWAAPSPESNARVVELTLSPQPPQGEAPLAVSFSATAKLTVPVAGWQLLFGDGTETEGTGAPPSSAPHRYPAPGIYTATLIVYPTLPFSPDTARFLVPATVTVLPAPKPAVVFTATPTSGRAPLPVSFRTDLNLSQTVVRWQIVLGDGFTLKGNGRPPRFTGHTYATAGSFRAILIVDAAQGRRFVASADIGVTPPPTATGRPTGRVLLNGRPFHGGKIPYRSKVDVTHGALT